MTEQKESPQLIPPHGGYRELQFYQMTEMVYEATVAFGDHLFGSCSRTHDQKVQAARSGKQNIAEGSMAPGIFKKTELSERPYRPRSQLCNRSCEE